MARFLHFLYKLLPRKSSRTKYLFIKPGHTLVYDVLFFNPIVKSKTPYSLVTIGRYSRYLNVIPLQSLKASCVVQLFEKNVERKYI